MRNIDTKIERPRRVPRGGRRHPRLAAGAAALTILLATAAMIAEPATPAAAPADAVTGPVSAEVKAVIDGDTIAVRARIWIGQNVDTRVRLAGVDTPELRGACAAERDLAIAARDFVADAIADGGVTLWDIRYDKYGGRVLARVETAGGADLAALLIAAGLGRAYDGGAREPWCAAPAPAD